MFIYDIFCMFSGSRWARVAIYAINYLDRPHDRTTRKNKHHKIVYLVYKAEHYVSILPLFNKREQLLEKRLYCNMNEVKPFQ